MSEELHFCKTSCPLRDNLKKLSVEKHDCVSILTQRHSDLHLTVIMIKEKLQDKLPNARSCRKLNLKGSFLSLAVIIILKVNLEGFFFATNSKRCLTINRSKSSDSVFVK